MQPLRLGLPKGRFLPRSLNSLSRIAGQPVAAPPFRMQLLEQRLLAYLLKPHDILQLLSEHRLDMGVVPEEWWIDHQARLGDQTTLTMLERLPWQNVRLDFFGAAIENWPPNCGASVATTFPSIAAQILARYGADSVELLPLSGTVEACVPDIASLGFDCVESGRTLAAHGLFSVFTAYRNLGVVLLSQRPTRSDENASLVSLLYESLRHL